MGWRGKKRRGEKRRKEGRREKEKGGKGRGGQVHDQNTSFYFNFSNMFSLFLLIINVKRKRVIIKESNFLQIK